MIFLLISQNGQVGQVGQGGQVGHGGELCKSLNDKLVSWQCGLVWYAEIARINWFSYLQGLMGPLILNMANIPMYI